jgi:ubiquitin-protein ligase
MSKIELIKSIPSKLLIKKIFSHLCVFDLLKIIKYNKNLQNTLNINFKNTIINFQYCIKTKNEIMPDIEKLQGKINNKDYKTNFCLKYSYYFAKNINEEDEKYIFLTKHKGIKINDYPLPSNFISLKSSDKIKILENSEYFLKYTLNDKNIELINLINELRHENNLSKLIYNKVQNLIDYFKVNQSSCEKNLLINLKGEFKDKILSKDDDIIKKVLQKNLKYIMILEKDENEYILIYSFYNDNSNLSVNKINNIEKFHIVSNIIPEMDISSNFPKRHRGVMIKTLVKSCNQPEYGYQIFSFIGQTVIGVMEGPPNTSYENGYFLFKLCFNENFPFSPPKFYFISNIFHPNISENGYVSVDIFEENEWTPALIDFEKIIISVQSLLDDPNPDIFLNEMAAKLYKEDKSKYDETVREYTSLFANYSKYLETIKKMDIKINTLKEGEIFKYKEK